MASSLIHRAAPVTIDCPETEQQRTEALTANAPQLLSLDELMQVSGGTSATPTVIDLPVNGW